VYLDKFKKHLIRLFRQHLHQQFDAVYKRKHYRWVAKSKRKAIFKFFTRNYNVPVDVYSKNEGIFVRLILNTVQDFKEMGVKVDPEMDLAMV